MRAVLRVISHAIEYFGVFEEWFFLKLQLFFGFLREGAFAEAIGYRSL